LSRHYEDGYDPTKEVLMNQLSEQQQQAVDGSRHSPARVPNPITLRIDVLLRAEDFEWIRQMLSDEPEAPRGVDPRSGIVYAILPEERYERFKGFFEEDPLTAAEKRALLREAGLRAGWNELAWDPDEDTQHNDRTAG
jgi:hypothetical protein